MRLSPALRLAARTAFRRARIVLPVSRALERGILAAAPATRTAVVPNAVDTSLFHPGAQQPGRIVSVGLFYEAKGHDLLLDAFREVTTSRPDVHLDLVGDGDLRPELERRAAGLPVTFHGTVPKPTVAELVRQAQLCVLPSRFETSGVAGIEALASGTPLVGMPVGAIPELIGEGDGVLAAPGELASAILDGLSRSFDREAIATRARERYGRDAVGRMLAEIYRTIGPS